MFKFEELYQVELEITNNCQASCPMCARNIHGGIENPNLKITDWSLQDFYDIFDLQTLKQVKKFLFCGSFGDPVINPNFLKMIEYIGKHHPTAFVVIHTNGSLQKKEWWKNLADYLPDNHQVLFALDGIDQKTHELHRIGTSYNKVIENARCFIENGGRAVWQFIRFDHNSHQVEEASQLAEKYNFKSFIVKDTRRFDKDSFDVVDKKGKKAHILKPTEGNRDRIVNGDIIKETEEKWSQSTDIFCYAKEAKSIYINSEKTVIPCCIKASFLEMYFGKKIYIDNNLFNTDFTMTGYGEKIQKQIIDILDEIGGKKFLDARNGIKQIIDSDEWQTIWDKKWKTCGSIACCVMCSKDSPFIKIGDQFNE